MSDVPHIDDPERAGPLHRKLHVHQLELVFRRLDALPDLPAVAARVLGLTGRGQPARQELIQAIGADRTVTSRLLWLARRKCPRARIEGIESAAEALGDDGITSAVLGMKVFEAFTSTVGGLDLGSFWRHCLAVAEIARAAAARREQGLEAGEAFLCGLLHDVGKLALGQCLPKSYRRVLQAAGEERRAVLAVEQSLLGTDHAVVGRRLGQHWAFPQRLQEAIWLHHQPPDALPSAAQGAGALAALVQLADAIAIERHFGFGGSAVPAASSADLARELGFDQDDLAALAADVPSRLEQLGDLIGARAPVVAGAPSPGPAQKAIEPVRTSERLANRSAALERQGRALERMGDFIRRITPSSPLPELVREIARAASALAGNERSQVVGAFALAGDEANVVLAVQGPSGREAFRLSSCRSAAPLPFQRAFPAAPLLRKLLSPPDAWADLMDLDACMLLPLSAEGRTVGGLLLPGRELPAGMSAEELAPLLALMGFALAGAAGKSKADALAEQFAQATQRLAETRQALAQAQTLAAIGEMSAGAAHEINNPLAVIGGRAQMLAGRARTKKDRQAAELIAQKAQEISDIATELMSFARPEPPRPAAVAVEELLSRLTEKLKDPALQKALPAAVDIQVERDCPRVWVDAGQIEQVLLELVRNAATAAGGPVNVRIAASRQRGSAKVLLRVRDDGPGMDEATLAAAFTPFYSHRPAGRGRGMGLARAKRTVQANGGDIWIDSRPNQGTTVLVELPLPAETTGSP